MANKPIAMRGVLLAGTALAGSLLLGLTPARAQDRSYQLDLPAQSLAKSLMAFGSSTDQQIVFSEGIVKDRTAPPLRGDYTAPQALALLLADSGLVAHRNADGVVMIERVSADPQSGSAAGGGADGTVDALIVTAQKREEDIQDVPIAISAFTQEDLTRSQVAGGPDLITQVPNMTFTKTNFSSYSIQLRGIGTQAISATTDPAVAVAFNNTPFIRNRFFEQEFYDLQRVEVLRGPQGTLYGRNATAGVVNIISQKPKFVAEAKLSADIGNFNSSRVEGMVNTPLVEDKVALRIAGAWTKRDGYAVNDLTGNPIDGRDLWSTRVSLRIAPNERIDANLIWEHFEEDDDRIRSGKQLCKKHIVTEVLAGGLGPNGVGLDITDIPYFADMPGSSQSLEFSGVQGTLSQGCERNSLYEFDSYQTPNGLMLPYYVAAGAVGVPTALPDPYINTVQSRDLRAIEATIDPDYRASADIGELQISIDLTDHLSLSSETAYGTDSVYSLQDFNRFNTAAGAWGNSNSVPGMIARGVLRTDLGPNLTFCDPQLGCSDRLVAVDISTAKATQFSQEFRLASNYDGKFNFSLGANFLRADSEDKYYVFINSLSLVAAHGLVASALVPQYTANVTDNAECLANGYLPGDPNYAYGVASCVYIDPNPLGSINDEGHNYFLSKNPYKLISYAVFGETYFQVTDNLKVTAGLRWTVDKKEAPKVPTWLLVSQSVGYPVDEVIEQEWREPTGRLTVDWKPDLGFTDETLLYASYAHGYKAGGANPPGYVRSFYSDRTVAIADAAESATRPKVFDAEFVEAYELGSKNTLLDGTITLNLAAFYYDYKDYQISEIVDRSAFNRNFDAVVWGIELEADWRARENLRFGLKVGYEETSIGDHEQAIDLMDRTAGDPNWVVVRPFPTYASSCILPSWLFAHEGAPFTDTQTRAVPNLYNLGGAGGGGPGGCELAYVFGVDPVLGVPGGGWSTLGHWFPGEYPGWDPSTAPNGGEGIMKNLGGNELPNAPNLTATITADYTIPLPNAWLATLHTDLHWQGESDWRVFQDHNYSQLDEYFTMNLAAIFTNEEAGWNVMAYIKNVTDETAITGAFLNSDDTGLTTNVFLTEPRLYGLRVTKAWSSLPWLEGFDRATGPFPLTVELSGQVQRHDAPTDALLGGESAEFDGLLAISDDAQDSDLDWGDGREARVTWRPSPGSFLASLGVRKNETNGRNRSFAKWGTDPVCVVDDPATCAMFASNPATLYLAEVSGMNHADAQTVDREEHEIIDFRVGREIDLGFGQVTVSAGLVKARLESLTTAQLRGIPDWNIPEAFFSLGATVSHTSYDITTKADRSFDGFGPSLNLGTEVELFSSDDWGRVELDISGSGGVLFGDQDATLSGHQKVAAFAGNGFDILFPDTFVAPPPLVAITDLPVVRRSDSVTAPFAGASLGLAYEVGRVRVGAGYRWERYFDALDVGFDEEANGDRTIDGPYLKLSVGFGG